MNMTGIISLVLIIFISYVFNNITRYCRKWVNVLRWFNADTARLLLVSCRLNSFINRINLYQIESEKIVLYPCRDPYCHL